MDEILIRRLLEDNNYDFYERLEYYGLEIEEDRIIGDRNQIEEFLKNAYDEIGYQLTKELIWGQLEAESIFNELEEACLIIEEKNEYIRTGDRDFDKKIHDGSYDEAQIEVPKDDIEVEELSKRGRKELSKEVLMDYYATHGFDCQKGIITDEKEFEIFLAKELFDEYEGNFALYRAELTKVIGRVMSKPIMIETFARFAMEKKVVPADILGDQAFFNKVCQLRQRKNEIVL